MVGLYGFSNGHQYNLDEVQNSVSQQQWAKFRFIKGDITQLKQCQQACQGIDYVLHQVALSSVPRIIADPISTNGNNISGFLNMLVATNNVNYQAIETALENLQVKVMLAQAEYRNFRAGDVGHSQTDVSKAKELLGYQPSHRVVQGINEAMLWYKGVK